MSPVIETNKKVMVIDDRSGNFGFRPVIQILSLDSLPGEEVRHRAGRGGQKFATALCLLALRDQKGAVTSIRRLGADKRQARQLIGDACDGIKGTKLTFRTRFVELGEGLHRPVYDNFKLTRGQKVKKRR